MLKAVGDETRLRMITLLLENRFCMRALARQLSLGEAAVSQHMKVLREEGLVQGTKKGRFMHYEVNRQALCGLAKTLETLAQKEPQVCASVCRHGEGGCDPAQKQRCHGAGKGHCHGGAGKGHEKEDLV